MCLYFQYVFLFEVVVDGLTAILLLILILSEFILTLSIRFWLSFVQRALRVADE